MLSEMRVVVLRCHLKLPVIQITKLANDFSHSLSLYAESWLKESTVEHLTSLFGHSGKSLLTTLFLVVEEAICRSHDSLLGAC